MHQTPLNQRFCFVTGVRPQSGSGRAGGSKKLRPRLSTVRTFVHHLRGMGETLRQGQTLPEDAKGSA